MAKKSLQNIAKTPIEFRAVTAKIPEETVEKFEELLKKTKQKRSALIRKLVEDYVSENSSPHYDCDYCIRGIQERDIYYVLLANREHILLTKKGKREIQPDDSIVLKIYCEKCAKKHNFAKHFSYKGKKPSHEMREHDKILSSQRID